MIFVTTQLAYFIFLANNELKGLGLGVIGLFQQYFSYNRSGQV